MLNNIKSCEEGLVTFLGFFSSGSIEFRVAQLARRRMTMYILVKVTTVS